MPFFVEQWFDAHAVDDTDRGSHGTAAAKQEGFLAGAGADGGEPAA